MNNPYQTPSSECTPLGLASSPQDLAIPGLSNAVYPLRVSFKVLAIAPQLHITDANGRSLIYVRQKLLKIKEQIEVFTDSTKSSKLGAIKANKVIDWSARYFFSNEAGEDIGSVGRKGMRSLWKASYAVFAPNYVTPSYKIEEENPLIKIVDGLIGEIPILGFASSFLFHPKYSAVSNTGKEKVMTLEKKPAFWEGKFELEKHTDLTPEQELSLVFSFVMLVLLERSRG